MPEVQEILDEKWIKSLERKLRNALRSGPGRVFRQLFFSGMVLLFSYKLLISVQPSIAVLIKQIAVGLMALLIGSVFLIGWHKSKELWKAALWGFGCFTLCFIFVYTPWGTSLIEGFPTATPTVTYTPTSTSTSTLTAIPTATKTKTHTPIPIPPTDTNTPKPIIPTYTPTATASQTPTVTETPLNTLTSTVTSTPTVEPNVFVKDCVPSSWQIIDADSSEGDCLDLTGYNISSFYRGLSIYEVPNKTKTLKMYLNVNPSKFKEIEFKVKITRLQEPTTVFNPTTSLFFGIGSEQTTELKGFYLVFDKEIGDKAISSSYLIKDEYGKYLQEWQDGLEVKVEIIFIENNRFDIYIDDTRPNKNESFLLSDIDDPVFMLGYKVPNNGGMLDVKLFDFSILYKK